MRDFLIRTFYHPVLFFFLLPIFYIATGVLFSLPYQAINTLSLVLFYLFILFNQMLENILLRIPDNSFEGSKKFVVTLEILNGLAILYFGLRHSWIASAVLIGFTLIIQLQFLFSYYDLDHFSVLVASLFKVILLNGVAFYLTTGFMHLRVMPYFFGLLLPSYLYEASRMKSGLQKKMIASLTIIGYLIGIVILWPLLSEISLLLLLSVPFAWLLMKEYNRKTAAIYSITYAFLYIVLIAYTFL